MLGEFKGAHFISLVCILLLKLTNARKDWDITNFRQSTTVHNTVIFLPPTSAPSKTQQRKHSREI